MRCFDRFLVAFNNCVLIKKCIAVVINSQNVTQVHMGSSGLKVIGHMQALLGVKGIIKGLQQKLCYTFSNPDIP